jgi:hypothetical protein
MLSREVTNTIFIVKPTIYSTQGILIYTCNIPKYDGLIEYNLSSYTCNIPKYDGLIEYNLSSSLSAKHATLRRKIKDWLARNQDTVSKWGNMSICGLLFQ